MIEVVEGIVYGAVTAVGVITGYWIADRQFSDDD